MFAQVIIALRLPQTYTYIIPNEFLEKTKLGVLVEVKLKNIRYCGIVSAIFSQEPVLNIKYQPILQILSASPIVTENELFVWKWVAQYYMCSEGEVFNLAVPSILKFNSENIVSLNTDFDKNTFIFTPDQNMILNYFNEKNKIQLKFLEKKIPSNILWQNVQILLDIGVLVISEQMYAKFKEKKQTIIGISAVYENPIDFFEMIKTISKNKTYEKFLLRYWQFLQKKEKELDAKTLIDKFEISTLILKNLLKKGILVQKENSNIKDPFIPPNHEIILKHVLSFAQQKAYEQILSSFKTHHVVLLNGITSSGKTEIYCSLIKEELEKSNQVLYLLPEIALTTQMINRLQQLFGNYIYVYHSQISDSKKKEIWDLVMSHQPCLVLGARSSAFIPFTKLSLTIIDEEHDGSFKQTDKAPRYNARDLMIYKSSLNQSKILLGSATPSIESFYNAQINKYAFVELTERFGNIPLPKIHIIDMKKQSFKPDKQKIISPLLKEKITHILEKQKQIILFHNKRGFAPYRRCKDCGAIPHCKHCDVSLTLHKEKNILKCHYCNTQYKVSIQCEVCKSNSLENVKFATEQIEQHIQSEFPQYTSIRLDSDTAKGRQKFDKILKQFETNQAQILIGTQMIVKGLDFENVELVAIVDGDSLFHFSDYQVSERAFQTIQQVSGRAGRHNEQGMVYIQLYQTQLPFLNNIIHHEYNKFCKQEINERKLYAYPPFSKIISISFKHHDKIIAENFAENFKNEIPPQFKKFFIGPSEPIINRIKDKYIFNIIGKLPKNNELLKKIKKCLIEIEPLLFENTKWKNVIIEYNVDC